MGVFINSLAVSETNRRIDNHQPVYCHCSPHMTVIWGYHRVQFSGRAFSLYIMNDVALAAGDSLIHLYADDTILYTSGPSLDTVNKPANELQCHNTPSVASNCF